MRRIEIDGHIYCHHPEYEGIQDLVDCMSCEYHVGIEMNYVVCAFAENETSVKSP